MKGREILLCSYKQVPASLPTAISKLPLNLPIKGHIHQDNLTKSGDHGLYMCTYTHAQIQSAILKDGVTGLPLQLLQC